MVVKRLEKRHSLSKGIKNSFNYSTQICSYLVHNEDKEDKRLHSMYIFSFDFILLLLKS